MTNKNRGMILEVIINKTIKFYNDNNIAIFQKKNLDISFKKVTAKNNELENAIISKKSTVDYYGIYKGMFICFEAKSTNENFLPWSNIKEHQIKYLKKIKEHGGISFFIILFKHLERFFILSIDKIDLKSKKEVINILFLEKNGYEIELMYPGIIDFVNLLQYL
ncbi:Holliday junction resolvase RecU [Mesomycoplasma lagogenitalium]|uniref:Holliday junction resolvase RecU n=1 Tax=Mesomycoplasma lagogenitalium TaxID=171286 RepID=A0ABY8LT76_9BACT|nr:Holliday junction resolvase RecU [Mesomycoplasma lagogenitalium]WGI36441.1 Holliday junction resolvase RecU [Mesomycoplasma lagogenitalium]